MIIGQEKPQQAMMGTQLAYKTCHWLPHGNDPVVWEKQGDQVEPLMILALPCSREYSVVAEQQHSGHLATALQPGFLLGPHLIPQPHPPCLLPPPANSGFSLPVHLPHQPPSAPPHPERAEVGLTPWIFTSNPEGTRSTSPPPRPPPPRKPFRHCSFWPRQELA